MSDKISIIFIILALDKESWQLEKQLKIRNPCNSLNHKGLYFNVVEIVGVEPTTSWLPVKRSSQLSYTPIAIIAAANIEYFFKKNLYFNEKITGRWSIFSTAIVVI